MIFYNEWNPVLDRLTLVLGGARSGKSAYSERMFLAVPPPWTIIATGQALDDEMRARIEKHKLDRDPRWQSIEAPIDLVSALKVDGPVLIDCLTLWVTNLMVGEEDIDAAIAELVSALISRTAPTVLVSNEVSLGIVPENKMARQFRDHAGRLHQRIAAVADRVVLMVAGIPLVVKPSPASS